MTQKQTACPASPDLSGTRRGITTDKGTNGPFSPAECRAAGTTEGHTLLVDSDPSHVPEEWPWEDSAPIPHYLLLVSICVHLLFLCKSACYSFPVYELFTLEKLSDLVCKLKLAEDIARPIETKHLYWCCFLHKWGIMCFVMSGRISISVTGIRGL